VTASYFRQLLCMLGMILLGFCVSHSAEARSPASTRRKESGFSCRLPPVLNPAIFPVEVLPVLDQSQVDCFAWQEFIALNWAASPNERGQPDTRESERKFGQPGDLRPLVWQTYKNVSEIFLLGGETPVPWEQWGDSGERCQSLVSKEKATLPVLHETNEAGITPPSWLVGQNGKKVFFETYVNRDMFEFIRENKFYNAQNQYAAVQGGSSGINAPAGLTRYGNEGAIEIKAAWLELNDPHLWPRFKMSEAIVYDADGLPNCRRVRVGLVGLHIIHKTPSTQQWTWATFEHVDNAPDRIDVSSHQLRSTYTFSNPQCAVASSFTACEENKKPECNAEENSCTPFHPIQVVRETPLSLRVRALNARLHQLIRSANTESVWQYYDLVDVMWPASSQRVPPGAKIPLPQGGMQPTILANTVIETYVQTGTGQKSCLDCHQAATIAPTIQNKLPRWGSDYSFVFARACDPAVAPTQCHPLLKGQEE
jgi:hypothetical protein